MSVNVLFEVQSKPNKIKELKSTLEIILSDTREYDGCMNVQVIENQDDPYNLIIMELWKSRQHYETYLEWSTKKRDSKKLKGLIFQPPSVRFYNNLDT